MFGHLLYPLTPTLKAGTLLRSIPEELVVLVRYQQLRQSTSSTLVTCSTYQWQVSIRKAVLGTQA